MLGDSITWSANVPFGQRYGDFIEQGLQARLGERAVVDVAICGNGSDTVGQGLARLERDVLAYEPDAVLINFGGNNLIRETNYVKKDLRALISGIRKQQPHVPIILETIPTIIEKLHEYRKHPDILKDGGLTHALEARAHRIIRRVAGEFALPLHDRFRIFQAALKEDESLNDQLICKDGVHLTVAGNRYFARSAAEVLANCLNGPMRLSAPAALWLKRAECNAAFAECCRCLRESGLELFLRSSGSWSRLMLQQARSFARRAERLATALSVQSRAKKIAVLSAVFSALQRALPSEIHQMLGAKEIENITWALSQLDSFPKDPMVRRLRNRLCAIRRKRRVVYTD